jgi:hypothetical protein
MMTVAARRQHNQENVPQNGAKEAETREIARPSLVNGMQSKAFFVFGVSFVALGLVLLLLSTPGLAWPLSYTICNPNGCAAASRGGENLRLWTLVQSAIDTSAASPLGNWHLVRTPGPEKGEEIVSVMHTADALDSDPEFAGLVIRCRPKLPLQIAFVLITPFPPRAHPKITVSADHASIHFKSDVIPPGSMLALPKEAEVLAKGPWQSTKKLTVDIEGDGSKIHGVVSLENLSAALAHLQVNCPSQ